MKKTYRCIWLILCLCLVFGFGMTSLQAERMSSAQQHLSQLLDQMDVENHWLPHQPIHWVDGSSDATGREIASHCSAFVAAVAYQANIYMLRPPDHSEVLLANAQAEWLEKHGSAYGWEKVKNPLEAQELANQGMLVVVAFKNANAHKPGHIAVVRPSDKSIELIKDEGPQIVQAGLHNYNSTSVKVGFKYHPNAWTNANEYQVQFYAHTII